MFFGGAVLPIDRRARLARFGDHGAVSALPLCLVERGVGEAQRVGDVVGAVRVVTPKLAVNGGTVPSVSARSSAVRISSIASTARPIPERGSARTNSSPLHRHSRSLERSPSRSTRENSRNARSPASWPWASLSRLKRSRSPMTRAYPVPVRPRLRSSFSMFRRSMRPVSSSVVACRWVSSVRRSIPRWVPARLRARAPAPGRRRVQADRRCGARARRGTRSCPGRSPASSPPSLAGTPRAGGSLPREARGCGGRYWFRNRDLCRVKAILWATSDSSGRSLRHPHGHGQLRATPRARTQEAARLARLHCKLATPRASRRTTGSWSDKRVRRRGATAPAIRGARWWWRWPSHRPRTSSGVPSGPRCARARAPSS